MAWRPSAVKIRLLGAPDLVRAWAKELERSYGVVGKEYPSRYGSDLRYYCDLDDRLAERVVSADKPAGKQPKKLPARRRKELT